MSTHLQNVLRARRGVPVSSMQQLRDENRRLRLWVFFSDAIIAAFIVWFGLWITGVLP